MLFTSTPSHLAPIGGALRYELTDLTTSAVDLRIYTSDNDLLGTKRIVGQSDCAIDIAPYLRNNTSFASPSAETTTGFLSLHDRLLHIVVEADDGETILRSDLRSFVVADHTHTAPSLLTALPHERLLAPSECDLVTLLLEEPTTVSVVEHHSDGTTQNHSYTSANTPLCGFWVRADDFPEAERLTVTFGTFDRIEYTLLPQPEGAVRLAWRSRTGALEHYTFPQQKKRRVAVEKARSYGLRGYHIRSTAVEARLLLESAYETAPMLEALAELLYAEQVWRCTPDGYKAVEVVTEQSDIGHCGLLGTLSVEIRHSLKNDLPWN